MASWYVKVGERWERGGRRRQTVGKAGDETEGGTEAVLCSRKGRLGRLTSMETAA
jgi:hypothetical protein